MIQLKDQGYLICDIAALQAEMEIRDPDK
jgi:hypothetical protein